MCGIAGIVGEENKDLIKSMCDVIEHRGPNDSGYLLDKDLSLGMRRLSIIDLAGGKQPIHNEDETVWVVYNGEIYNYLEIRSELESFGHRFYTKSDTEVFVHAYEQYGDMFVERLRGMFGFALWDMKTRKLILGRDRLGKKPLYYTLQNGKLIFGSEIKSILQTGVTRRVNWRAADDFMSLGYVPGPITMFEGIYKLLPGSILVYQNGEVKISKYWEVSISNDPVSEAEAAEKVIELLKESVRIRLMSEVPLGVYLSGGIDSSSVVALMSSIVEEPIKTFTVGFGEDDIELKYARLVSNKFKTDHRELIVHSDVIKILPDVIWHFDEPLADAAALPTYQMSEVTKKFATVTLLGEGGDEAFAGYDKYRQMLSLSKYSKLVPYPIRKNLIPPITNMLLKIVPGVKNRKYLEFLTRILPATNNESEMYYNFIIAGFDKTDKVELNGGGVQTGYLDGLLQENFSNRDLFTNMIGFDFKVCLPDRLLMKVDKMTMANSIEARVPFLDHKFVEYVNTLPRDLRLNKYILRKSMKDLLPKEIVKRRKRPFIVPITKWLNSELKEISTQIISGYENANKFNYSYIKNHIMKNPNNLMHNYQIWNLMIFRLWHKMFIETDSVKRPGSLDALLG
ncbi:MAG: asparagine synthase (glutamine-hydrolyzing) [Candidatus Aenigmarchaeota archaeon]|nr:asparagine synthase (glutamine-hydrolyzing) [Candidatus Aenigmarchaeota archaeon]